MGRSKVRPIQQPDDTTCGPSALKTALKVVGIKKSLKNLIDLCNTNSNGTSTKNMVRAIKRLGLSCLVMEHTTLRHLLSALKYSHNAPRATLVSYLYDVNDKDEPHPESGHWATVSSYLSSKSRIVLLDSSTGSRKSYGWEDFRDRWWDYDLKRIKLKKPNGKKFKLIKNWQTQLMMVIAKDPGDLPDFTVSTARVYTPGRNS